MAREVLNLSEVGDSQPPWATFVSHPLSERVVADVQVWKCASCPATGHH